MKKALYIFLLFTIFSCKKNTSDTNSGGMLREIRTASGIYQSFEYTNGLLSREVSYQYCPNPVGENVYFYQNGKLDKVESTPPNFSSNSSAQCNPITGVRNSESYEYDPQGRIVKAVRQPSYSVFQYNANGNIEKHTLYFPNGTPSSTTTYLYDSRGNMLEETSSQGYTTRYQYDDKINPYYHMKQKPGLVSPFNVSPNNVIKGTGTTGNFEIKILEYKNNMPYRTLENGVNYTYVY